MGEVGLGKSRSYASPNDLPKARNNIVLISWKQHSQKRVPGDERMNGELFRCDGVVVDAVFAFARRGVFDALLGGLQRRK